MRGTPRRTLHVTGSAVFHALASSHDLIAGQVSNLNDDLGLDSPPAFTRFLISWVTSL